eukprot:Gb_23549 [translate_table: standard]
MDSPAPSSSCSSCSVIVVGAGVSGIMAAKTLADNGVKDFVILEASDKIGGRLLTHQFGGITVESGAGWVQGVGGKQMNPIWELAQKHNLRTCYSDYSNARFNIYDQSGNLIPRSDAAASYERAVKSSNHALALEASMTADGQEGVSILTSQEHDCGFIPSTPTELAIDYILHDFEMAEVEPIPTYTEFGESEFLVADNRGYDYLLQKLAQDFLKTNSSTGDLMDDRLKLQKVVREIEYTNNGVTAKIEDGSVYNAKWVIVSVSLGVLQSELINFTPDLPIWKVESFFKCDIRIYTKIFLKFPRKFWPTGSGTEFFLYADDKRGYYTFWQHMENAYPGSNILVVTVTNDESKRIEDQDHDQTKAEAMEVLRKMFGNDIPEAEDILVPTWWNNRFQRGSYTNYPILTGSNDFHEIRAPIGPVYFTGEHTSQKFNGYVHGAYLAGIDTAKMLVDSMMLQNRKNEQYNSYSSPQSTLKDQKFGGARKRACSSAQLHKKWEIARELVWRQITLVNRLNVLQVDSLSAILIFFVYICDLDVRITRNWTFYCYFIDSISISNNIRDFIHDKGSGYSTHTS